MISERINRLSFSQTLEMSKVCAELRAKGMDIIDLSVGQPDFYTPPHVKEAAKKAIDDNYTFYPPVAGYDELRQAISDKLRNENHLEYSPNQIVVSNGAKQALANAVLSLVNKDDEVLIPAPYWVTYAEIDNIAEGKSVFLKTSIENDFKVTPEQVERAITYRTKAFLFSSPSNPTGSVYTKDELEALARVFAKYDRIYVITDEIYEYINYIGEHQSIARFDFIKDRVIIINGVSKGYSMTGWRIGYVAAPDWIAHACEKLQGQYTSGACSIAQKAAYSAITEDNSYTLSMKEAFQRRRDLMMKLLADIPGIRFNEPEGAFYIFPDVSHFIGKSFNGNTIYNVKDLSVFIMEEAYVATVPGSAFGDPNGIRLSYATSDENIEKALKRIKEALAKLK